MPDQQLFDLNYFLKGPYHNLVRQGLGKYLNKYFWARRFYARLLKTTTPQNGRILEIGCGFGDLLSFLEKEFQTVGIDISPAAIAEAEKKLKRTTLLLLPAEGLGRFNEASFDTIAAFHLLEHLSSPEKAIKLIANKLKRNGVFIMATPNPDSLGKKLKSQNWIGFQDKTHISLLKANEWLHMLSEEGLTPEKVFSDGLWDSPYLPLIPNVLQKIIFGLPAVIQIFINQPILPPLLGESLVIVARKNSKT